MSEVTYREPNEDGTFDIDFINGEWFTAYNVSKEDVQTMKDKFDYDYIENKYGWVK